MGGSFRLSFAPESAVIPRAQELCEQGGGPGFSLPIKPSGFCGRKAPCKEGRKKENCRGEAVSGGITTLHITSKSLTVVTHTDFCLLRLEVI